MSAPLLWVVLPIGMGGAFLLVWQERWLVRIGTLSALGLALLAWWLPIDEPFAIGSLALKVDGTLQVLGRAFTLEPAHRSVLAMLYGLAAMWFFGSATLGLARRVIPLGMSILGLMVAMLAVRPFLYAAVFLGIAVLLSVPMLLPFTQRPGRGVVRYVIFHTLVIPFLLFAGWLFAGIEASPGDVELTVRATAIFVLGFAFLLSIFPLYTWIPMALEESSPYTVGFLLWLLPQATALFGMGFLDQYAFLRLSENLPALMRFAGLVMVVTAGVYASFENHAARLMGYGIIAETGFFLLTLSLGAPAGVHLISLQILPRGLGVTIWAFSLAILQKAAPDLRLTTLQGKGRAWPWVTLGIGFANLSLAGLPLLAGFPPRLLLLEQLAVNRSLGDALWLAIGLLGLISGAVRTLGSLVLPGESAGWKRSERVQEVILIGLGIWMLIGLGLFPQLSLFIFNDLSALFERLGQGML